MDKNTGVHNNKSPANDCMVSNPTTGGQSAGVGSGLSHVGTINELCEGQRSKGSKGMPCPNEGPAGSKGGKIFKWG